MTRTSHSQPGVTVSLILDDGEWRRAKTMDGGVRDWCGDYIILLDSEDDDDETTT